MLRRKIAFSLIVVVVAVILVIAWVSRNSNMLRDFDASEVEQITFQDSNKSITITDQDDIQDIFEELQTMRFKSMIGYHRFGSALVFDIKFKDGQKYTMAVLSDDIIINGKNYKPDKDYRDALNYLVDQLS